MNTIFEKYAMGNILTDSNGMDYDELLDTLEYGGFPDGVSVYEPFENYEPETIARYIVETHDWLKAFAEELGEN